MADILCTFSCALFGGFKCRANNTFTLETLIDEALIHLRTHLQTYNLTELLIKLDNRKYHIHDYTIEDIRRKGSIFICSHDE